MSTRCSTIDRGFDSVQPGTFSSEAGTGLLEKNLLKHRFRAPLRSYRAGNGSRTAALRAMAARVIAFGIVLFCFLAGDAAIAGRRVALVIGNSAYRHAGTLPNTLNDARAIAALLKNAGFDVVDLRQDLGVLEFKRTIRGFMNETRTADIAIVYYAGHGIEAGGTNYVIPVDAKLATDYDAEDETVSLDRIILALQPARKLRLIILDACRENPFLQKIQRTVSLRGLAPGLGKIENVGTDTLIAYAAKAGSVSYDGDGANSPFTTALLKYIAEPGLDIRLALGKVRDEVLRDTNNEQEPYYYGSLGGTPISLVPADVKKSEPQAAETNAAVQRDYEMAERVGTRQTWESFLSVHGSGFYADLARAQLAKLSPPSPDKAKSAKAANDKDKNLEETRLSKPSTDRRPIDVPNPTPPAASSETEATAPATLCSREEEKLNRLRANPDGGEIARFAKSFTCASLRPQVARLLDSINPAPSNPPETAVPTDGDAGGRAKKPAPDTIVASPQETEASPDRKSDETTCKRDADRLVKLRANPVRQDIERFARDLHCEALRAQVARLLESIGD